jgi:putative salt-induced outer membrane protein
MKRSLWFTLFSFSCLAISSQTQAHDEEKKPEGPWSGEFALGYLSSSGNTDDSSATFEFKAGYDLDVWHHALHGKTYSASNDNESTAENYALDWKTKYDLNAKNYVFGAYDWNKDRFSSYPRQNFLTAGYGRRILDSDRFVLNIEIGAGYSKQRAIISDTEFETIKETQEGGHTSLGSDFTWNISDNATFGQSLTVYNTSDNTRTDAVTRLKTGLVGALSLELSYTVQHNTDVAPELDKTDTYTAIALNYSL